jgi:ribosome-associated heat shock protein Hsp15
MAGRRDIDERDSGEAGDRVRIDRWVWAARFVKSRELAADAVRGGRVQVDGERVKPSRPVKLGDRLEITIGEARRTIVVRAITDRRGPAAEAARLYEETAESIAARESQAAERRLSRPPGSERTGGRPTKRDRRRLG